MQKEHNIEFSFKVEKIPADEDSEQYHKFKQQYMNKKQINYLQNQNQTYKNKLKELNDTLNKLVIEFKGKISKSNLQNKLNVIQKSMQNTVKMIQMYKKQLKEHSTKQSKSIKFYSLSQSQYLIKQRQQQFDALKKQVKSLELQNKRVQQKLLNYSKKGKRTLTEQHTQMKREYSLSNHLLKQNLQKLRSNEKKSYDVKIKNTVSEPKLKRKVSLMLPTINKKKSIQSLSKLSSQKQIYSKWLDKKKPHKHQNLIKQIEQAQNINQALFNKINSIVQQKIKIQQKIKKMKQIITPQRISQARQINDKEHEKKLNQKEKGFNCDFIFKKERRDWIGRFGGLRFSDSRFIKDETRLYKILFNQIGYYQFFYYKQRNHEEKIASILPFQINNFFINKKEKIFQVQYPDYIKEFKVKISKLKHKIVVLNVISNLGKIGQFNSDQQNVSKKSSQKQKSKNKQILLQNSQHLIQYTFNINQNEAPKVMFGSYSLKYDENNNVVKINLQGLGVELIQNYVQEFI